MLWKQVVKVVALKTQGPLPSHLVPIMSDGDDVVADYSTTSGGTTFTRTASYVNGLGIDSKHVKLDGAGSPTYYVPDALGSVGVVIDAAGTVTDARLTNAWGEELRAPQTPDRYGYTHREAMPEIAILGGTPAMHYRARSYFPELGRFVQNDPPLRNRQFTQYVYCHNNPIIRLDPKGLADATVFFEGMFQTRLALNPDPSANLRGTAAARVQALEGEPDFDRVIRLTNPVALRSHPLVAFRPTRISGVDIPPFDAISPQDTLVGLDVNLGPQSMFALETGEGPPEPIRGFEIILGNAAIAFRGKASQIARPSSPILVMTAAELQRLGIKSVGEGNSIEADFAEKVQSLERDYAALSPADRTGTPMGRNLKVRIDILKGPAWGTFMRQEAAYKVHYKAELDSEISIRAGSSTALSKWNGKTKFSVEMTFMSYDSDAQVGIVNGKIEDK